MKKSSQYILTEKDLTHVLDHVSNLFLELRGQSVFVAGGTGFFGMWLVESFLWCNEHLKLDAHMVVLSRDSERVYKRFPHLRLHRSLSFVCGDVRDFKFQRGSYAHIVHAASTPLAAQTVGGQDDTFETIAEGTARVLEFAEFSQTKSILFVSSGAVYDSRNIDRPILETDFSSDHIPAGLDPYARGKIEGEQLGIEWAHRHNRSFKIARCFSFLGPCFPLEATYAASMFFRNALHSQPIQLTSAGTALRSYLYAADLAIWLWTILLRGKSCRPYNVGSSEGISVFDFASKVASHANAGAPILAGISDSQSPPRQLYIPNVDRVKDELSLVQKVSLDDMIARTFAWYRDRLNLSK